MNRQNIVSPIERKLLKAAKQLPAPTNSVPVSPLMKKLHDAQSSELRSASRRHIPAWQASLLVLAVLFLGSATALAASPELRAAVVRFFSFGTVETPPADLQNILETKAIGTDESQEISPAVQTVGSLTLTKTFTLDEHFSSTYLCSPDFLDIVKTPSGTLLFSTTATNSEPHYYSYKEGSLTELVLETHTLSASVNLGVLPGVMDNYGDITPYQNLQLPEMTFDLVWQQYGDDILIDHNAANSKYYRFDIGSAYGADLDYSYDGAFSYSAFPTRSDVIQVIFRLDSQQTSYAYPFLLDLTTGQVSDPLAKIDLSAYDCITELSFTDDLTGATAKAGSDHDHLRDITIRLDDGTVTESPAPLPPVGDSPIWFTTSDTTVFYTVGSLEGGMDGCLYNTETQTTTTLFTDALYNHNAWAEGYGERFFDFLGGGYCTYYEDNAVYLMNLKDGSRTLLEGLSLSDDVSFFFNPDYSLLNFSIWENQQSIRLGFIDPAKGEAWYFDREMKNIYENASGWYGNSGYYISAQNEISGIHYLYLYEYTS